MPTYLVRRIGISLVLLLAVLFSTFLLLHALPGDPTHALLGRQWNEQAAARVRQQEGLNDPFVVQFGRYLNEVILHGDLGYNQKKQPIADDLRKRLPATIELAIASLLIASVLGLALGILAALRPRSVRDLMALTMSLVGVSIPIFWLGLIVQRLLGRGGFLSKTFGIGALPLGGRLSEPMAAKLDRKILEAELFGDKLVEPSGFHVWDAFVFHDFGMLVDALAHLALPAMVLATVPLAMITRITRSAVGEQLAQEYVRTARAKGLSSQRVVRCHVFRNAAIPIVTAIGTQLGYLLGGAVLTETIFNWPGMGTYTVQAIINDDIRALQAAVLTIGCGFVVLNLAVDMCYVWLDPRVRTEGARQ